MADSMLPDEVRRIVGTELSDADVAALAGVYARVVRDVAGFPSADLKAVEPPLRSIAGPNAT